jgi:hypothetical protein
VYGAAVQRAEYRDAKLRTVLETVSDVLEPGVQPDLAWRDVYGERREAAAALVVSNNPYGVAGPIGEPTRPRLDTGVLGVVVLDQRGPRTWSTPAFEIDALRGVPAGIDGEAVVLTPPLRFRVRPAALRCRIARHHPGASPSAFAPASLWECVRALARIAGGHDPEQVPRRDEMRPSPGHAV